jgi:hypothetical protein
MSHEGEDAHEGESGRSRATSVNKRSQASPPRSPPELYPANARQLAQVHRPKPVATSDRFMECMISASLPTK